MALKLPTVTQVGRQDESCYLYVWGPFTEADTCQSIAVPNLNDKSIHVSGTFGGASVALQGSNNNEASYTPLRSPDSVVIAVTAETIKAILENTAFVKPVATGGTGQSLTCSLLVHQTNPLRQ